MQGVFVHLKCFTPMFSSAVWTNVHRVFFLIWWVQCSGQVFRHFFFPCLMNFAVVFLLVLWVNVLGCSLDLMYFTPPFKSTSPWYNCTADIYKYIHCFPSLVYFTSAFRSAACGQMYMFLFRFLKKKKLGGSFADLLIYPSVRVSILRADIHRMFFHWDCLLFVWCAWSGLARYV